MGQTVTLIYLLAMFTVHCSYKSFIANLTYARRLTTMQIPANLRARIFYPNICVCANNRYNIHMKRINYYVTDRQYELLKQISNETETTVSELIRRALDEYLPGLIKGNNLRDSNTVSQDQT